jgi:hypothetical protein
MKGALSPEESHRLYPNEMRANQRDAERAFDAGAIDRDMDTVSMIYDDDTPQRDSILKFLRALQNQTDRRRELFSYNNPRGLEWPKTQRLSTEKTPNEDLPDVGFPF